MFTTAAGPRTVRLRAKADRIDLLADGTLRVVDYKLGKAPKPARALQLPVYGVCAQQSLEGRHGRSWTLGRAGYVAFREKNAFVALGGLVLAWLKRSPPARSGCSPPSTPSSGASFRRSRTSRSSARAAATPRCAARTTSAMSDARRRRRVDVAAVAVRRRRRRRREPQRSSGPGCRSRRGSATADPDASARDFAIDPRNNVVLEASAGTGKTSVLVWRYINLLKAGVEPGNILAITFTRKAAAEMRERIIRELKEAAARSEFDKARWNEVRDRLGEIAISTIDAFCLSLLREFPLEADLDPGFEMADETEVPRLVEESLDRSLRIFAGLAKHGAGRGARAGAARRLADARGAGVAARAASRRLGRARIASSRAGPPT